MIFALNLPLQAINILCIQNNPSIVTVINKREERIKELHQTIEVMITAKLVILESIEVL